MLDQYLCALSEDLGDPDILALEAPLEDDRIQENLVRVRRTSVALKQDYVSNAGRETSPHPHVYLYLLALEETLLESNYLDLEALSQILTICRSLWDIETGNVTSGDYQDALELLGISDMIPITTQGGT